MQDFPEDFPEDLQEVVTAVVADAVSTVFGWIVPLILVILALGFAVRERPLRTASAMSPDAAADG